MAYKERFYHTYCDRYGNEYRISLRQKDYIGEATPQEAMPEPWKVERELPQTIKKGGVMGSKATAMFLTNTSFSLLELYSAQEDTFQLVRLKNDQINWIGFIDPAGIVQGDWDGHRTSLEVNASDKLASLQGVPFVDEVGESYGQKGDNIKSFLWVIKECLLKTGVSLPIRTLVDLKSREQGGVRFISRQIESISGDMSIDFTGDQEGAVGLKDVLTPGSQLKLTYEDKTEETYIVNSSEVVSSGGVIWSVKIDTTPDYTKGVENVQIQITPPTPIPSEDIDPLNVTEHDVRVWVRDSDIEGRSYFEVRGGSFNSYEVLDYIALQWNIAIYQNEGKWVVKRWNVDKADTTNYAWFEYTPQGEYTGRAPYSNLKMIPCSATPTEFRVFGATMGMDRVLKNVIVNYRFKYKQEGDTFLNLLNNGDMTGPFNPLPSFWAIYDSSPEELKYPRLIVTKKTTGLPTGIEEGVTVEGGISFRFFSNITERSISFVNKGDVLKLTFYQKIDNIPAGSAAYNGPVELSGTFAISLYETKEEALNEYSGGNVRRRSAYDLMNNSQLSVNSILGDVNMGGSWYDNRSEYTPKTYRFIAPVGRVNKLPLGETSWRKVSVVTDPVPFTGFIAFSVMGVTGNEAFTNGPGASLVINPVTGSEQNAYFIGENSTSKGTRLNLAQFTLVRMVDPKSEVVPQIDPFMYPSFQQQLSRAYTDTTDDIEVLTGDDYGSTAQDRISGMIYQGVNTSVWDSWGERYGWSRQGLITSKSVIEMYWKPTRTINCEINIEGLNWDTILEIEELPGYKFTMLRGALTGPHDSFKGLLSEIYSPLDEKLPPGGEDGNGTVEPQWERTGVTRCKRDVSGQNTGILQAVERDINQASPTYGQERWVDIGENTGVCPIGDPVDIMWGESVLANPNNLRYYPYSKTGTTYTVSFSGDGSDKLLRLIHLSSLGVVRTISYEDEEQSQDAWVYEADITVAGLVYKSLKLSWPVGIFNELNVNFEIN